MRARTRLLVALALSCSVYLIPLLGRHTFVFLGEWLRASVLRGTRSPAWTALEIAVALALQAIAFGAFHWILGGRRALRALVLVPLVPAAIVGAHYVYLLALPTRFLIERETGVERASWPVACAVPGETLAVVGRKPSVVREPGDAMVVQNAYGRLARLTVWPAADGRMRCEVESLGFGLPSSVLAPIWVDDRGRALLQRMDQQTGAVSWEWRPARGATASPLTPPPGRRSTDASPVVAGDGSAIAWLTPLPDSGQPPRFSIVVRPFATAGEVVIPLDALPPGRHVPLDLDPGVREALLAIDERSFAAVGYDGALRWGVIAPDGVEPLSNTLRRVGSGWIAWDGYREEGYRIAWSLAGGRGHHRVPRGSGITDLAVTADGRLIAFSTTTSVSIGAVRDAVVVLRAADGAEVFRRFLPRYARSSVSFPSPALFAYTEAAAGSFEVRLLRVPEEVRR